MLPSVRVIHDGAGKSRGFGFVSFDTPDQASAAVHATNGAFFEGRSIRVSFRESKVLSPLSSDLYQNNYNNNPPPPPPLPQGHFTYDVKRVKRRSGRETTDEVLGCAEKLRGAGGELGHNRQQ